ncbi:UNVERIFIED_ORG: hypothetical protein ABIB21_000434 [Arthrobacter sp. UYEF13]
MSRPIQTPPPRRQVRVAGIVAAALVISWGGPAASAYWQTLSSNDGRAKADSILAVVAPTASASAGAATVSWAQGATAAGKQVSSYIVARYSSATGGTKVAAGGGCSGTITTRTCSEAALPSGTWYYTVTPVLGSWAGQESARSTGVTIAAATPPAAPTLSVPPIVNIAKAAGVTVSVTAESGSSVTITVTDAPPAGTQQQTATQTLTANGSVQSTDFNLSAFKDGTITYTAVATNAAGGASAPGTATSTKDTVAPTASIKLQTGPLAQKNVTGRADQDDQIIITFSKPMNPSSICSEWTSTSQALLKNSGIQVRIDSNKNLKVIVPSTVCPTFTLGTAVLGGVFSTGSTDLVFAGGGSNATAIAWSSTATSSTLTITLGPDNGASRAVVSGNVQSMFTAVDGPKDTNGNPISLSPLLGAASNF